jgi:hypothetical protein
MNFALRSQNPARSRGLRITFVFAQWWASEAASCPRNQTLNEDNTLNLHVTPPLRKHFVTASALPSCQPLFEVHHVKLSETIISFFSK